MNGILVVVRNQDVYRWIKHVMNISENRQTKKYTIPSFLDKSEVLIEELRKLSPDDISELMKISPNLGQLNFERNLTWDKEFNYKKQASRWDQVHVHILVTLLRQIIIAHYFMPSFQ